MQSNTGGYEPSDNLEPVPDGAETTVETALSAQISTSDSLVDTQRGDALSHIYDRCAS